jgi:hypothetical protein
MAATSSQPARRVLLTERDVAALFSVTTRTVQAWGRSGVLNPVRVGGVTRYRADDIDRLIGTTNDVAPAGNRRDGKASDAGARRTG